MTLHLRNGRAEGHNRTHGAGTTWCGKKLLGAPVACDDVEIFSSYGVNIEATFDPRRASCARCSEAFEAAYNAAFPDGPQPIATFKLDDPETPAKLGQFLQDAGFPNIAIVDAATGEARYLSRGPETPDADPA